MNVIWYTVAETGAPAKGYWCYGFLEEIFADATQWYGTNITAGEGAVVIIPAEYHVDHVDQINEELSELPWVRLILASDERGIFPVEQLDLPNMTELWVMTPHFDKHVYPEGTRFLGEYYPQDARALIAKGKSWKVRKWKASFSGQITHQRRTELQISLDAVYGPNDRVYFNATAGFTQGLGRAEYYQLLTDSRVVPAPSGPVTLDSFRAFEALEAGAVPILDLVCPVEQDGVKYWNAVLGAGHPLPTVHHWAEAIQTIDSTTVAYRNYIFSWWQLHKRTIRHQLTGSDPGKITVLVATSPITSHPSSEILDETIVSIRHNLPHADIIIMCDGVRAEQRHLAEAYHEYVEDLCWKCNTDPEWSGIYPLVSMDHQHQGNMTKLAMEHVWTPTILFVEHDTPLVLDRPYDWDGIVRLIEDDEFDVIRFHYAGEIHPEHEHMMRGAIELVSGVPVRRTVQWSQRPHVAGSKYYRDILKQYFPAHGRTMIEDRMHSWSQVYPQFNRIAVYHPKDPDGQIIRSYHTDGRGSEPKFEMDYGDE